MDIQTAIISLYPDAQFAGPRGDAGYDGVRWHKKPAGITEAKVLTKLAELIAAYPLQELREKRTQLLAETDWVVIRARENGGQVPAAWKTYRVALRDLPSGLDTVEKVNAVTWPTKPS